MNDDYKNLVLVWTTAAALLILTACGDEREMGNSTATDNCTVGQVDGKIVITCPDGSSIAYDAQESQGKPEKGGNGGPKCDKEKK